MSNINEREILEMALGALEKSAGLRAGEFSGESASSGFDFSISLLAPGEKESRRYSAEIKRHLNSAIISSLALQAKMPGGKFALVSDYIPEPAAEKLRGLGIPFFDTAGNAFFSEPGLYINISGKKGEPIKERASRLFRPPGMKVIYSLLSRAGLESKSYREISKESGVPTATVGLVMKDLTRAGYLVEGISARALNRKAELLQRFVSNYGENFRLHLDPVRFRSEKYPGRWWEKADLKKYGACWGGETGGAILTKHLKPAIATIFADSLLPRLQLEFGLIRDRNGNTEILRRFWKQETWQECAPPLIIYADLMATAESRNIETAQMIYEKYLAKIT